MTALALLQQLRDLGIVLTPYPDRTLRYKAPEGTLTSELLDGMRRHKEELHGVVEAFEERASSAEYCGGLSRPEAEVLAWACLLAEPVHGGCAACGYPDAPGVTPRCLPRDTPGRCAHWGAAPALLAEW
jgi:hypothetical protein